MSFISTLQVYLNTQIFQFDTKYSLDV